MQPPKQKRCKLETSTKSNIGIDDCSEIVELALYSLKFKSDKEKKDLQPKINKLAEDANELIKDIFQFVDENDNPIFKSDSPPVTEKEYVDIISVMG